MLHPYCVVSVAVIYRGCARLLHPSMLGRGAEGVAEIMEKSKRTLAASAFLVGYKDGLHYRTEITRRAADEKLRGLSNECIESYMNGRADGVKRDNFRVKLINAQTELRAPYGATA